MEFTGRCIGFFYGLRETLGMLLRQVIDDEVFLSKYSNNTFESMKNLLYVDFKLYGNRLLDALQKEAEAQNTNSGSEPAMGESNMPPMGDI